MKRRRLLQLSLALPFTALGLSGCGPAEPLAVGLHPWPGYEPLLLARDFGWLGDTIRLQEGGSGSDSIAGLKAGKLDAACLTLDEVIGVRVGGLPLTVILVLNESVGADVVMARPDIRSPADLKGKRIAVEKGAVGALVLHKLLAAGGLTEAAVTLVDQPPSQHLPLWQANQIDASITYPPFAAPLAREGAVRLFDSRQFPQTIFDVLAVRSDRIGRHASALRALVAGHLRGLQHLRTSREDALRRIAARRQLSFEDAEASYGGLNLPDLPANRRLLAESGGLLAAAGTLSGLMTASGLLPAPDPLTGLASTNFLPPER